MDRGGVPVDVRLAGERIGGALVLSDDFWGDKTRRAHEGMLATTTSIDEFGKTKVTELRSEMRVNEHVAGFHVSIWSKTRRVALL